MEKFICLLAVLVLTAPVFAGDIVLYADDIGGLQLEIGYVSYTGDPPVALALKVDAGTGNDVITAYVPDSTSFFDVFIDYIAQSEYDTPGDYELGADPDTGSHPDAIPTADPDPDPALGIYALDLSIEGPVQVVALCMGSLTTDINEGGTWAPNTKTPLAILQFTAETADVEVGHDTARGSIIDASGVSMGATISINGDPAGALPGVIDVTPGECYVVGQPRGACGETITQDNYDAWVAANKPEVWCCPYQPCGDANGDGYANSEDYANIAALIGMLAIDYPREDVNHDGFVNSEDYSIIAANIGAGNGVICPPLP